MVQWLFVDEIIAQLGFYLTATSQLILIFLTLFYVRKDLGAYKHLIILFSIVGIAFASLEFVLNPVLHSYNTGYICFVPNHLLGLSNFILTILIVVDSALFSFTISILAVQFTYRYIAVFHTKYLKFFNGWYFLLSVLYPSWFGLQWAIGLYNLNEPDDFSIEYMRQVLQDTYEMDISQVPCVIHVVYQHLPNTTQSFIRWRNVMCTFNMAFIMIVQYGIMIYCGSRLYAEMEEKLSMVSPETRKLHRQTFKTLMLQIATPTIVLFSPIFFVIIVPFFDLELSVPTGVFLSGFALYPAFDAFIIMYVVTDYRQVLKNVCCKSKDLNRAIHVT